MVLLNGRVSPRSFEGWQRAPKLIRSLLAGFALALAQSDLDAERLRNLGAKNVLSLGNLKFAAPPLPAEPTQLAILQSALSDRPRWLAASTHAGEEIVAGRLHARLEASQPRLLTIVVPRHPDRGAEIASALTSSGLRTVLRSSGQPIAAETQIYVADTLGELGLFYRLTEIAFMGKSLISESQGGGQNPLEPARLGLAVLHGPFMENFAAIAQRMEATGAALRIADEDAFASMLERLLGDAEERKRLGEAARTFAGSEDQVLPATVRALAPFFDGATAGGEPHARA
jgi:3-deoxy-D-manno-octulosonic-acid transferase